MIPKSGNRFSGQDHAPLSELARREFQRFGLWLVTGRGRGSGTVTGGSESAVDMAGGGAFANGVGVRVVHTAGALPALTSGCLPAAACTGVTATGLAPEAAPEARRSGCLGAPTNTSIGSTGSTGRAASENSAPAS